MYLLNINCWTLKPCGIHSGNSFLKEFGVFYTMQKAHCFQAIYLEGGVFKSISNAIHTKNICTKSLPCLKLHDCNKCMYISINIQFMLKYKYLHPSY